MKIFNSKTNKIETFIPLQEGKASIYVCGPTVYNEAHIGNARPLVVFDTLRRTLMALGYDVDYVSNYTDVDDRIIAKAIQEGVSETVITARYIHAYETLKKSLNVLEMSANPRATEHMEGIIAFISELIEADYAYEQDGDVYFRVHKIKDYGAISGQNIDALLVGARVDANSKKENPLDFTLWKRTYEGIKWESPWGAGRPGWHTECVVMIQDCFAEDLIDIHAGGYDLRFPHHENESAQCKALHHHDLANYWMHNAFINFEGEKMSKSLGNVVWAREYVEKLGANATRWLLLSTHYRLILNITDELISQVQNEMQRIEDGLIKADIALALADYQAYHEKDDAFFAEFMLAMSDDLNTANAQAVIFEVLKKLNQSLRDRDRAFDRISQTSTTLRAMLDVLGIMVTPFTMSAEDKNLYHEWQDAKYNKDFERADILRLKLQDRGLV